MATINLQYTRLTHWVKVESENHDFYVISDDFGNMVEVNDESNLFSLTGFWV